MNPHQERILIYTDGSCIKNPGGAGTYAFVVVENDVLLHQKSGHEKTTTNNRMEMMAVLAALSFVYSDLPNLKVTIFTDSQYVYNGIVDWMYGWHKRMWKRQGQDIPNRKLWEQLYEMATTLRHVDYRWVRGHAGNKWNEMADQLCTSAYKLATTAK